MPQRRFFIFAISLFAMLSLFLGVVHDAAATSFTIPNRQPWNFVAGPCTSLDGAVFAVVGTGCGGTGTTFDTAEVFSPVVIKDIATTDAPCSAISVPLGETCYRMWYVGTTSTWGTPRIGYALSPDGLNWTRVPGAEFGGSVFDEGPAGDFDDSGVTYMVVMKEGNLFRMWYSGYDAPATDSTPLAGIGYATSMDGMTWTRIPGPLTDGAVLRAGVPGDFDEHEVYVPYVLKDIATIESPCGSVTLGEVCYRMWYEGTTLNGPGYRFRLGYGVSPDGLDWTRIPGNGGNNSNLGGGSGFDANSVAIAIVIKEGVLYRNWYEAKAYEVNNEPALYTIGHVVSISGTNWVRPIPNVEVYGGANDPATNAPDNVWSHWVMKDGVRYRMWYTTSTRNEPAADRIAYATMVPGTAMPISRNAAAAPTYSLTFTTTVPLPEEGYVLITLPPDVYSSLITTTLGLTGFATGATLLADDYAITDAAAANAARGALLVRLTNPEPAGVKTITFTLSAPLADEAIAVVQTFDSREVWEYGLIDLLSGTTAVQLRQTRTTANNLMWPAALLTGMSLITLVYWSRTRPARKSK
ncbi:MAG: hypothetical protein KJ063_07910 [Anaerolineae bacterium]|nr:hypothetical protein [Anaerolineae bacterium]